MSVVLRSQVSTRDFSMLMLASPSESSEKQRKRERTFFGEELARFTRNVVRAFCRAPFHFLLNFFLKILDFSYFLT